MRSLVRLRREEVGGSPRTAAGDDAPVADTQCDELKCRHQRMREGQAMGGRPWIAAGDDASAADSECDELNRQDPLCIVKGMQWARAF